MMSLPFALRFDFRNPNFAGTSMADRYAVALDMVEWADTLGCRSVIVSEHHGSPDGYLPSPLPMVAAMAARTKNIRFTVSALIAPFYDPLRLAEDMVVLDNLSFGRVDLMVAGGYVRDEFAMYGASMSERGIRVTEVVTTLKAAFRGEPFNYQGRTVHVTPQPFSPGGPPIMMGGSSEAAARRAARIADGFFPTTPDVWEFYNDELAKLGRPTAGPCPVGDAVTVALADNPEEAWKQMGPFFLHEMNRYGAWLQGNNGSGGYQIVENMEKLQKLGRYRILRPDEYIDQLKASPAPFATLHPLCGGTPPDLAWPSLKLFESHVLPAFLQD